MGYHDTGLRAARALASGYTRLTGVDRTRYQVDTEYVSRGSRLVTSMPPQLIQHLLGGSISMMIVTYMYR